MPEFWENKTLYEMTNDEWESLCDGCGRCCLNKLEDEDTGELYFTNVVCRLLEQDTCRCGDYSHRTERVETCGLIKPAEAKDYRDLPATCAYRLLAEGKRLPDWHPLVSDDPESVHDAGVSVQGRVVSEAYIHPEQLEEHIIFWEPYPGSC